jgi:hypothetical protein
MSRARVLAVVVLLLSYGAVGARQPAVRATVSFGASAADVGHSVGIETPDRSRLLLDIVRIVFDAPDRMDAGDARLRAALQATLRNGQATPQDVVPLPLDPSIWRDSILQRQIPDNELIAAILAERSTALLYHGLAALDDETLAALGPDRETLQQLRRRAAPFAAFGRSVRIHAGRVAVPGGADAEPLWQSIVGADPTKPAAFTRRLFSDMTGRLAYMYDTIAHLDPARQRFALGLTLPAPARLERLRTLLDVFEQMASEWRVEDRPFTRPQVDPALTLSLVAVSAEGTPIGPLHRRLWNQVFRGDESVDVSFVPSSSEDFPNETDDPDVDAAWLVSRIQRSSPAISRRRLDTFLFAQRMWPHSDAGDRQMTTALRGFGAFPSLLLGLERIGLSSADALMEASTRAHSLNEIHDEQARRTAMRQFQAIVGILDRAASEGGLTRPFAQERMTSLLAVEVGERGYDGRLAAWVKNDLMKLLPEAPIDSPDPIEDALLAAMAGLSLDRAPGPVVQWEKHAYRVDPARAEFVRLKRVRELQRGASLDAALDALAHVTTTMTTRGGRSASGALASQSGAARTDGAAPAVTVSRDAMARAEQSLADTLTSILYAAHLGDPEGAALEGGNVALRHDLGLSAEVPRRPVGAWRLPHEQFGGREGWHISGSLIGLETALGRLSLRRMDSSEMPGEPRLSTNERQTLTLTVALFRPAAMTDAARDEIAQAVARGRARLASMSADRDELERVSREAGLSEWRRESLGWTLAHDRESAAAQLSLVELMWLGAPRPSEAAPLDPWGTAVHPLTGAMALQMPRARACEEVAGRSALGLLATRGADVAIAVAEVLAARHLPGSLAPGVIAFAMQDAIDGARLAYFDDWSAFGRATREISTDRMTDYIAALAAGGPLVPADDAERRSR